jgi:hypothetical protein
MAEYVILGSRQAILAIGIVVNGWILIGIAMALHCTNLSEKESSLQGLETG